MTDVKVSGEDVKFKDLPNENILDESEGEDSLAPCSVMLSYNKKDRSFVHSIYTALKHHGREIWFNTIDHDEPTLHWQEQVYQGIENSDCFVFVCSAASNNDGECTLAIEFARRNGKRIVVVTKAAKNEAKDEVKEHVTHKLLADQPWVTFSQDGSDFQACIDHLRRYLDDDQRHAQYHTKILRRAIQWERHDFEKSLLFKKTDLTRANHWLSASALGRAPKPTTLHLSFITASSALDGSMKKRRLIAMFFFVIVTIGIAWPSWGVFFFSLVFSHFFVYFSSHN